MNRFGLDIPNAQIIGGDSYRKLALYYDGREQKSAHVDYSGSAGEWGKSQVEAIKSELGSLYERIYPLKSFEVREYD